MYPMFRLVAVSSYTMATLLLPTGRVITIPRSVAISVTLSLPSSMRGSVTRKCWVSTVVVVPLTVRLPVTTVSPATWRVASGSNVPTPTLPTVVSTKRLAVPTSTFAVVTNPVVTFAKMIVFEVTFPTVVIASRSKEG